MFQCQRLLMCHFSKRGPHNALQQKLRHMRACYRVHGIDLLQTPLACCWQVCAQRLAGFQGLPEEGGDHDVPRVVPVLLQVPCFAPTCSAQTG